MRDKMHRYKHITLYVWKFERFNQAGQVLAKSTQIHCSMATDLYKEYNVSYFTMPELVPLSAEQGLSSRRTEVVGIIGMRV